MGNQLTLSNELELVPFTEKKPILLSLLLGLSAGFPSPAADFIEHEIDILKILIKNPSSTFLGRVQGNSMEGVHIHNNDIIVIDKSRIMKNGDIAVCYLNTELLVKRVYFKDGKYWLVAESTKYPTIEVKENDKLQIWGVVISVIKLF